MTSVVFVHGLMGGSRQWEAQRAALANDYDIITPDLPGFGDHAHLEARVSIADYASWLLNDLDARGVARFRLIGHSMGGMIAQQMVAQEPDRVDQLVLYGTGATGVLPGRFESITASRDRACEDGSRSTARRIAATWFLKREAAMGYEACAALAERSSLQAILAGLDAMQGWNGVAYLPDIQTRTLLIWGDQDRTYPWDQTEQLWRTISDARLAVIPDCAHAAHLEKPRLFNSVLQDFLSA